CRRIVAAGIVAAARIRSAMPLLYEILPSGPVGRLRPLLFGSNIEETNNRVLGAKPESGLDALIISGATCLPDSTEPQCGARKQQGMRSRPGREHLFDDRYLLLRFDNG